MRVGLQGLQHQTRQQPLEGGGKFSPHVCMQMSTMVSSLQNCQLKVLRAPRKKKHCTHPLPLSDVAALTSFDDLTPVLWHTHAIVLRHVVAQLVRTQHAVGKQLAPGLPPILLPC